MPMEQAIAAATMMEMECTFTVVPHGASKRAAVALEFVLWIKSFIMNADICPYESKRHSPTEAKA